MRLLATLNNLDEARRISAYLTSHGIDNQLDANVEKDWGSQHYGTVDCRLWITDEDQVDKARELINEVKIHDLPHPEPAPQENAEKVEEPQPSFPQPAKSMGYGTFYLLISCIFLFFMSQWSAEPLQRPYPKNPIVKFALLTTPTTEALLYDFPKPFQIVDQMAETYGVNALNNPQTLPNSAKRLYNTLNNTPYWKGLYPAAIDFFQNKPTDPALEGPMFEKISQGEVWRLVTPIFLHADIFHLLFNMLWLIVLSRQLEQRLGTGRLLAFVVLSGIFSNTSQYLMSGFHFLGISGVLCAMIAYVWDRQRSAPWEGYQIQRQSIQFIFVFIFGLAALQTLFFFIEASSGRSISFGFANTAHISGAFIGYLFSRLKIFKVE